MKITERCQVGWAQSQQLESVLSLIDGFDRPKAPWPDPRTAVQRLNQIIGTGGGVVIAQQSGKAVGTCTLIVCPNLSWSGRPFGIIENVIVDAASRGRGIGKAVLSFAVEHARQQGCYKVALMTGSQDEGTHQFYRSANFQATKTGYQIRF